jgi:hypothetical protein
MKWPDHIINNGPCQWWKGNDIHPSYPPSLLASLAASAGYFRVAEIKKDRPRPSAPKAVQRIRGRRCRGCGEGSGLGLVELPGSDRDDLDDGRREDLGDLGGLAHVELDDALLAPHEVDRQSGLGHLDVVGDDAVALALCAHGLLHLLVLAQRDGQAAHAAHPFAEQSLGAEAEPVDLAQDAVDRADVLPAHLRRLRTQ